MDELGFTGGDPDGSTTDAYAGFIDMLVSEGLTTGVIETSEVTAGSGNYAVTATVGADLIALGAATGYHTISGFDDMTDAVLLNVDAYDIHDNGSEYWEELSFDTGAGGTEAATLATALNIIDTQMGADDGNGGVFNAVNIDFADQDGNSVNDIYAFDTDGDGTADLTVHIVGDYYTFMPNTADPDAYMTA